MAEGWLDELAADDQGRANPEIHNGERWEPSTWPKGRWGSGFMEAPRGALGHWIRIENGIIGNYQMVVPSTWNGSPSDHKGQARVAYEEALVGTPMADPRQPVEILRTIHSFDPCMACAIHMVDARGRSLGEVGMGFNVVCRS